VGRTFFFANKPRQLYVPIYMKKALLLNNLGTPDAPEPEALARYLKEFLMDEDVITIPYPIRWFLVNLIIVPRRKYESAKNYQKVWTERGSPLMLHTEDLTAKLQSALDGWRVDFCMRYGKPSIASKVAELAKEGVEEIHFLPLYPQFAKATTGSAIKKFQEVMQSYPHIQTKILGAFYFHEDYLEASKQVYETSLPHKNFDHYLFSFHGLPKKDVMRGEGKGHCMVKENCCFIECEQNKNCYVSQCKKTAVAIAKKMGIENYTICFQSRLGPTEWVKPYTEDTVIELAKQGVKSVAVFSPAFVADCIETIEELSMGLKETFEEHGGKELFVAPCLNASDEWVHALTKIVSPPAQSRPHPQP